MKAKRITQQQRANKRTMKNRSRKAHQIKAKITTQKIQKNLSKQIIEIKEQRLKDNSLKGFKKLKKQFFTIKHKIENKIIKFIGFLLCLQGKHAWILYAGKPGSPKYMCRRCLKKSKTTW